MAPVQIVIKRPLTTQTYPMETAQSLQYGLKHKQGTNQW